MSKQLPLVTVLMPVYNGELYLKEAIESILAQTYKNFEFIIVNDGSTDKSQKIIQSFTDKRIRPITLKKNQGLSNALNTGLDTAAGKYIARMDCDDLSGPERLEKQVKFLEANPDYGIVGTLFALMSKTRKFGPIGGVKLTEDEDLKFGLLFGNVYVHGEVMVRAALLNKHNLRYDPAYNPCEDYELWCRLSKFTKFKTLPDVLYYYMMNPGGMTGSGKARMDAMVERIAQEKQASEGMPSFSLTKIFSLVSRGLKYKDAPIVNHDRKRPAYLRLMYQVYIFRLGKIYATKYRRFLESFTLILASILISPVNCFRHMFKLFPNYEDEGFDWT
jgi:glycosyltransferase involved in cell wall biosynthesis